MNDLRERVARAIAYAAGDDYYEDNPYWHKLADAAIAEGVGAVPAWQPIKTAPRDGSEVLLGDDVDTCAGFWSVIPNRRSWASPDGNWFAEMDRGSEANAKPLRPTHWMSLPTPPAAAEKG